MSSNIVTKLQLIIVCALFSFLFCAAPIVIGISLRNNDKRLRDLHSHLIGREVKIGYVTGLVTSVSYKNVTLPNGDTIHVDWEYFTRVGGAE